MKNHCSILLAFALLAALCGCSAAQSSEPSPTLSSPVLVQSPKPSEGTDMPDPTPTVSASPAEEASPPVENIPAPENTSAAAEGINISCNTMEETIASYFALRGKTMTPNEAVTASTLADEFSILSENQEFVDSEVARRDYGLHNLAEKHGVHVSTYQCSGFIESTSEIEPSIFEVEVYEWNWVSYNNGIDEMGYQIDHTITLQEREDGTWKILDSVYDEYNFLGSPEE